MSVNVKRLLMGNEAIGLGALRAGVEVVTGYPGTPSTEILETVAREVRAGRGTAYVEWSVNEKAALEVAAGAACAGRRSLVTMKQVGLNVASDPLMCLNYLGVTAGLVVAVADDPGPISSQTEQDTRRFGRYAKIPVFDPESPEEAFEMAADAFAWSERVGRPVILRPTTRICHAYASIGITPEPPDQRRSLPKKFERAGGRWVIFPGLSRASHERIERDLVTLGEEFSSPSYPGNRLSGAGPGAVAGIAAGGVSAAYVREHGLPPDLRFLKVGTVPVPQALALEFLAGLEEVLVVEELDPVIEDELVRLCGLHNLRVDIRGKRSGDMPHAGEYSPGLVAERIDSFLERNVWKELDTLPGRAGRGRKAAAADAARPDLPARPPTLCPGCPHRASFFAVKEAARVFADADADADADGERSKTVFCGDIGCYTLGNAPPLDMVDTCLCMGAGITMAQGIRRAEPGTRTFAFVGDSTFFHSGVTGIVNAVYNNADIIVVVLDNGTTAMTGNQPHPGTGATALGGAGGRVSIPAVLEALGVALVVRANPLDQAAAGAALREAMAAPAGVRAVVFEAPCVTRGKRGAPLAVDEAACVGCLACVTKLGCPALVERAGKAAIDRGLCAGCGLCAQICPAAAIVTNGSPGEDAS